LKGQSELFYFTSIEKLCDSYQLGIDKSNEYVKKICAHLSMPCLNRLGSKLFERPSYTILVTLFRCTVHWTLMAVL